MSNTPPKGLISRFQMKTMLPPVTMPAMAPDLVTRFQKSEKSMMGPKVAPNPAQANDTTLNMILSSSRAIIAAIADIITSTILVRYSIVFVRCVLLIIPW